MNKPSLHFDFCEVGGRKGVEIKAHTAHSWGPGLELGTCCVLGEGPQLHAMPMGLYLDLGTCMAMSIHLPRTEHMLEFNLRM